MSSTATTPAATRLKAIDVVDHEVAETLGRVSVLERLFDLMAANHADDNNQYVDFGEVREEHFWHGLNELARCIATSVEAIETAAHVLDDQAKTGGDR